MNPTLVSAVQFASIRITKEPDAATTFFTEHVASFVRAIAMIIDVAETVEFVTVIPAVPVPAAKFTVPAGKLIV